MESCDSVHQVLGKYSYPCGLAKPLSGKYSCYLLASITMVVRYLEFHYVVTPVFELVRPDILSGPRYTAMLGKSNKAVFPM